jgi:hypothetical protein
MAEYMIRKVDDVPDAFGGRIPARCGFLTELFGNQ